MISIVQNITSQRTWRKKCSPANQSLSLIQMNTTASNTANYLNSSMSAVQSSNSASASTTNSNSNKHYHSNSYHHHHGAYHHNHHHHCSSYQIIEQHDSQLLSSSSNAAASATLPATPSSKKIFGVDLRQLELCQIGCNENYLIVPSFLKFAIEYISEYINQEGIFRRNGTASRLKELKVLLTFWVVSDY